jgi:hypothetical protein
MAPFKRRLIIWLGVYAVPVCSISAYLLVTPQYIPELLSTNKERMSTTIMWQFCHKKELNNNDLTRYIVKLLQEQGINIKQAASDLDISVHRAHNWYYKDTGMTALDLLWIMQEYECVRKAVESSWKLTVP